MNDQRQQPDADAVQQELVAYLDGELDAASSERVERRLAGDERYRSLLSQLQQAWDFLDELPRAEVRETFARTTVEMIAVSATEALGRNRTVCVRRRTRLWICSAVAAATAAAVGCLTVWLAAARSDRLLAKDLPVIERIDVYRHAESVEFLRELERVGLFAEESDDGL